jgi:stage II sporulation protein D
MRRLLPVTLLAALLAALLIPPAAADGATRHVVKGRGWGHGIGMSQFGAYGFARRGSKYRGIIAHYYRGVRIRKARTRRIRVLLQASRGSVAFRGVTRGPGGRRLNPSKTYVVRRSTRGRLSLRSSGGRLVGRFSAPFSVYDPGTTFRLLGRALSGLSNGRYRGFLKLRRGASGGVTAVNSPKLDQYVRGVIPAEMPTSWSMEALKAQAVAARSYGLATRKRGGVFDAYPDTRSQVYRGATGERPRSNRAVGATSRQVATYRGRVALTLFFSTSGGRTESIQNVFYGASPTAYLRSVRDPYDSISPRHRWSRSFTTTQMTRRLAGLVRGTFVRISVLKRGVSPRIIRARIYGTRGTRTVTGQTLRWRLGLYDAWARFYRVSTSRASASRTAARRSDSPARAIVGSFDPKPRRWLFVVERRVGGAWRTLRTARTLYTGAFRVTIESPGIYRVRAGDVVGPAVRVT